MEARQAFAGLNHLLQQKTSFFRSFKTTLSLLIHFGSRCDTIDSHEKSFSGLHNVEQILDVTKNIGNHLRFGEMNHLAVIRMSAVMNDTIHIQIKIVKDRANILEIDGLVNERVALGKPSKELGNAHFLRRGL
jgi:hypothetical protein